MTLKEERLAFDAQPEKIYESALLTFTGVEGFDVYNCSIPFAWQGETYILGRVERRGEWARSWVRLFRRVGPDAYTVVADPMTVWQLEDPFVQFFGGELVMGGTHVRKRAGGQIDTYYGYFYRGTSLGDLAYFATGPDRMKDIRLCPLADGRIGVFSRARGPEIEKKYGSGAVIGFYAIDRLEELTAEGIERAPAIGSLFGRGEWGGCNQCYLLRDGRIGIVGHKSMTDYADGERLLVYLNVAFVFDPVTHTATAPRVIGTRKSYPPTPSKRPNLIDCAFTSGIVLRPDGKADLYSGVSDCAEGRVVIDNPFEGLL